MSVYFKGSHYPKSVILYAVFFYVRYAVSYRDLEEIMAERGVKVDHATLNRWVIKYSPDIAKSAQQRKLATGQSWRMDEIFLHSHFPEYVSMDYIKATLSRRSVSSVRGRISDLKGEKLIFGDNVSGYRLTSPGHAAAVEKISKL